MGQRYHFFTGFLSSLQTFPQIFPHFVSDKGGNAIRNICTIAKCKKYAKSVFPGNKPSYA